MAEGVEVGHPIGGISVGDPGGLQVGLDNEVGVFGKVIEDRSSRRFGGKPGAEGLGEVGADRLDVIPPAL
jgi:hypothetical protein